MCIFVHIASFILACFFEVQDLFFNVVDESNRKTGHPCCSCKKQKRSAGVILNRLCFSVWTYIIVSTEIESMGSEYRRKKTILKQKSLPFPANHKNVRFADGCGLSLVSVHKISMDDLTIPTKDVCQTTKELTLTFPQPVSLDNFIQRLKSQSVSLENILVSNCTLMGTVKVKNVAYHKLVLVRCSYNGWKSFEDFNGCYVPDSCDGTFDRFSFTISVPGSIKDGDKIEFAVCYRTVSPDEEFWDNNDGRNYVLECTEKSVPRNESYGRLWSHVIPNFKR